MQFLAGVATVGLYNYITSGESEKNNVGPALFYFFSPSCKFCTQFAQRLDEYKKETNIEVIRIDLGSEDGREDAKAIEEDFQIQIRAVPSVLLVSHDGKKTGKEGFQLDGQLIKPPEGILVY